MLLFGYLGEKGMMDKRKAQIGGFVAFFSMILIIYMLFIREHFSSWMYPPLFLLMIYTMVWALYGVAAELDDLHKNLMYKVLDVIAKVFFGLGLWVYYGGVTAL